MLSISFECEIIIPTLLPTPPWWGNEAENNLKAVHRMCTSCHLSAQSPLTPGITAQSQEGRRGARLADARAL